MEKRLAKVSISAAGGTAGKGAKTYKLTIPSTWIAAMGITKDGREVELSFEDDRIVIAAHWICHSLHGGTSTRAMS